jgi:hypothetical protein
MLMYMFMYLFVFMFLYLNKNMNVNMCMNIHMIMYTNKYITCTWALIMSSLEIYNDRCIYNKWFLNSVWREKPFLWIIWQVKWTSEYLHWFFKMLYDWITFTMTDPKIKVERNDIFSDISVTFRMNRTTYIIQRIIWKFRMNCGK